MEPTLVRWNACLEEEELETVNEATGSDHEEVDSQSLKVASARLDVIREEANEALTTEENASIPAELNSA